MRAAAHARTRRPSFLVVPRTQKIGSTRQDRQTSGQNRAASRATASRTPACSVLTSPASSSVATRATGALLLIVRFIVYCRVFFFSTFGNRGSSAGQACCCGRRPSLVILDDNRNNHFTIIKKITEFGLCFFSGRERERTFAGTLKRRVPAKSAAKSRSPTFEQNTPGASTCVMRCCATTIS